ncbi:MAG: response regulator [Caldilineales bacterium]|nr:response regulator [Caldilineales bacterium]
MISAKGHRIARKRINDSQNVPEYEFTEAVKDALTHLYDFPHLQNHALILMAGASDAVQEIRNGQWLRREIMMAIDMLAPEDSLPFRAPQARPHQLLQLRYVEGMTVQEVARELGVSERQAYRDLRRGEESVSAILWTKWSKPEQPRGVRAMRLSSVESEVARLEPKRARVDLESLIRQAIKSVDRLAAGRGIQIEFDPPAISHSIAVDPVLSVQLLTRVISHAVQRTVGTKVSLSTVIGAQDVAIELQYKGAAATSNGSASDRVLTGLADRLGWSVSHLDLPSNEHSIRLKISLHGPTILIIDDNQGLVELLDRYLTGHDCKVLAATDGREGLALALNQPPQAVILDVMMPDIDGWEVLQRLRTHPDTADLPVIICSVFDDPELAYSLGASLFVPKPIRRVAILDALRELGIV